MDLEANRYRAALFVGPADGSSPAQAWTDSTAEDAVPRWSPDGSRIAFVSDRGEVPEGKKRAPKNVVLVEGPSATGAAPRSPSRFADDCADLAWLPDGSAVIVTLKGAETAQPDDAPRVYDRLRYKSDDAGMLDFRRKHLWLVPLVGEPRRLTDGDWDDTQPAVSPDGTAVAFTSNRSADRDRNSVSDIWIVPLLGGDATRVTTERGQYANASWSPDGKVITCLGTAEAIGAGARNTRVWRFARTGGSGQDLLGSWDRTTGSRVMSDIRGEPAALAPAWTPDGSRILFIGSDQGTANLYSVKAQGGDVRAETLGAHQLVAASVDRAGRCFAGVVATATSPGEVVTGSPGGALKTITTLNADLLRARYIAAPEHVEYTGADGWTIEGWILKPRGFDLRRSGRWSSRSTAARIARTATPSFTSSKCSRAAATRSCTRTRAAATRTATLSCARAWGTGAERTTRTSWPASITRSTSAGSMPTGST